MLWEGGGRSPGGREGPGLVVGDDGVLLGIAGGRGKRRPSGSEGRKR